MVNQIRPLSQYTTVLHSFAIKISRFEFPAGLVYLMVKPGRPEVKDPDAAFDCTIKSKLKMRISVIDTFFPKSGDTAARYNNPLHRSATKEPE